MLDAGLSVQFLNLGFPLCERFNHPMLANPTRNDPFYIKFVNHIAWKLVMWCLFVMPVDALIIQSVKN